MNEAGVDFAIVAWQEEGTWTVVQVPEGSAGSLEDLELYAGQRQGDSGALTLVSVAEEFFIALRVQGSRSRFLLSDVSASLDWPLAEDVTERLGLEIEDDDEVVEGDPAGDLTLLADFRLSPADVDQLCGDLELFPDEQIASIAARAGFGEQFSAILDQVLPVG
jgi:putative tRNA adenosine deaminase-associated protein